MHTWRLVDVGVFFTFFLTPFCSASFFSFLGTLRKFFLPNCPIASTIRSIQFFFFWTLCGFFLNLFWGPPYLFTPKDIFFPALPLF